VEFINSRLFAERCELTMEVCGLLELPLSKDTADFEERFHVVARHKYGKLLAQDTKQDDPSSPDIDS
jgi:hypothetical protein